MDGITPFNGAFRAVYSHRRPTVRDNWSRQISLLDAFLSFSFLFLSLFLFFFRIKYNIQLNLLRIGCNKGHRCLDPRRLRETEDILDEIVLVGAPGSMGGCKSRNT